MDNKKIGRWIRMIRQDHNLKQEEFCDAWGLSRFSLGRIERGDQTINGQSFQKKVIQPAKEGRLEVSATAGSLALLGCRGLGCADLPEGRDR